MSRDAERRLVLWDVDLTLVDTRGVSLGLYAEAFHQVTGQRLVRRAWAAGRMDPDIFRDTLALHGIANADHGLFRTFSRALGDLYAANLPRIGQLGRALPGASEALATLALTPGVSQSVLTGNVRPVAICKVGAFGLDGYLDLDLGAFGSEAPERAGLVGLARSRADLKHGFDFPGAATVLIGDTPHDVAAAKAAGAAVVAVATGSFSRTDLVAAGASVVLDDLTGASALIAAIGL